jgi:hypothetical protein
MLLQWIGNVEPHLLNGAGAACVQGLESIPRQRSRAIVKVPVATKLCPRSQFTLRANCAGKPPHHVSIPS